MKGKSAWGEIQFGSTERGRHHSVSCDHSVGLGTDPPRWTGPPRQTKSPDISNMLHMFNNNTYTDFRTAYKQVLIPSYVIQVI